MFLRSFNIKMDLVQTLYEERWIMNIFYFLNTFDTSIGGQTWADSFKSIVKSISYESATIEWE